MLNIILAGALGVVGIVVFLLFRQLRTLSWQLTQLRVERDSERILRDIGLRAGSSPLHDLEEDTEPVRKKRHLALYLGGLAGIAATLRERLRAHRGPVLTAAAGTVAAAVTVTWLLTQNPGVPPPGQGRNSPTGVVSPAPTSTHAPPGPTDVPRPGATPAPGSDTGVSPPPSRGGTVASASSWRTESATQTGPPTGPTGPRRGPSRSGPPPRTGAPPRKPDPGMPSSATPTPTREPPGTATALVCVDADAVVELSVCLGL